MYVAIAENNRQNLKINSLEKCKKLRKNTTMCSNLTLFPYENAPCEIEVITKLHANAQCHPVLLTFEDTTYRNFKKRTIG